MAAKRIQGAALDTLHVNMAAETGRRLTLTALDAIVWAEGKIEAAQGKPAAAAHIARLQAYIAHLTTAFEGIK